MKTQHMIFSLLLTCLISHSAFAENYMKKTSMSSVKKQTIQKQRKKDANSTFYKTMAKDITNDYKLKGKEMNDEAQVTAAGSNFIKAGDNSQVIVIQENHGYQQNVAIGKE